MADPTARRAVYKRGTYPGQVDHPGWLSKVVEDAVALAAAVMEGWQLDMTDPSPAIPAVAPEPAADGPSSDEIRDADVPVSEQRAYVAPTRRGRKLRVAE